MVKIEDLSKTEIINSIEKLGDGARSTELLKELNLPETALRLLEELCCTIAQINVIHYGYRKMFICLEEVSL